MDTEPFFRAYDHPADIVSDLYPLADRLGKKTFNALYEYAKYTELHGTQIVRPPLLSKLPPCIPVNLDSLRRETRHLSSETYFPATDLDPIAGIEEIRRMVDFDELPRLLQSEADQHAWIVRFTGKPCETGLYGLHFYQRLKHEAYLYMKSGKTGLPIAEIRRAVALYTVLLQENSDVRHALATTTSLDEIPSQNALAELLFSRVPGFLQSISWLDVSKICRAAKFKLQAMHFKPSAKIAITHELNSIASMEQLNEFAREKLPALLGAVRTDPQTIKKARDLLSSYSHEAGRLPVLFKAWFLPKNMELHFARYRPKKLGHAITKHTRQVSSITERHTLRLYPCKDLLEYSKGKISHDCTVEKELAARHLGTLEFFNLRVVSHERWVGNIYCLDFSETHQCVIIDKVQVPGMFEKKEWNGFFSEVTLRLAGACGKAKLLLPDSNISNEGAVCDAFDKYKRGLTARIYEPNHFKGISRLKVFESVRKSRRFMVV